MTRTANPWTVDTRTIVLAAIFGAMVIALQVVGLGSIPVPNVSGECSNQGDINSDNPRRYLG
jgi:hypothetical protein